MQKTQRSSSKIVTSEAFQRVTDETLQESHFKVWHHGRSTKFSNSEKWKTQNHGRQNKLSKTKKNSMF